MSRLWKIAREWEGETCAVIASGPSMSQETADYIRDKCRVIAINDNYRLAPWADILYAADHPWWRVHHGNTKAFMGRKVTIGTGIEFSDVYYLENGGYGGFDIRPTHVRTGKNSGYQAIHVAMHLGAKRVLLCGFDMREIDGKRHWFGDHPKGLNKEQPFGLWLSLFNMLVSHANARGVEIVNCTPKSALHCFKKQRLEEALESVLHDKNYALV